MEVDASVSDLKRNSEPLSIRVTSGGKMKSWVEVALKSFKENPKKPVVLHTLPNASKRTDAEPKTQGPEPPGEGQEAGGLGNEEKSSKSEKDPTEATQTHQPSVSVIPRIVSVVEIIKREYLRELPKSLVKSGLHQYNRIGILEEDDASNGSTRIISEEERTNEILAALSGSNNLKIQKTPYMRIMLSAEKVDGMDSSWTYQEPLQHKLSRSARYRFKKQQHKESEDIAIQQMETDETT